MIRGLILLLPGLWFSATLSCARADESQPRPGYVGSSLVRDKDAEFLTVDYVAAQSPAAMAGVEKGDSVEAIDGISTKGMSITEASHAVDGNIDSVMKLTVRRAGSTETEVSIVRRSALDTYLPAATAGDRRAEFELGHFYDAGTGDWAKAVEWYRKAADQGYAPAQVELGYLCDHGVGISKDPEAAAAWYLKAARQGDAVAERNLAQHYYKGDGVPQSDQEAFKWFYSSARQDDAKAEEYLGLLYSKGRGVAANDREAFAWYYRAAEQDNPYGEWALAYMYEKGLGVAPDIGEALKWYRKAQAGLPQSDELRKDIALISLRAFLENPGTASVDLSLVMTAFRSQILLLFYFLAAIYGGGGAILFYFSFKPPEVPIRLLVALGWVVFYEESQLVALLALFVVGKTLTAETLIIATSLFSALPVIASTCGPLRARFWMSSPIPWKTLLFYGAGAGLAFFISPFVYAGMYGLFTHSAIPVQPTVTLITKTKHASSWLAYASIAVALPMAEEIMFRGYLFDALKRRFSGKIVVAITAFAFSLAHFQGAYFIPLFAVGVILGWLRLKTGSLRLPVLLHALNNGICLVMTI